MNETNISEESLACEAEVIASLQLYQKLTTSNPEGDHLAVDTWNNLMKPLARTITGDGNRACLNGIKRVIRDVFILLHEKSLHQQQLLNEFNHENVSSLSIVEKCQIVSNYNNLVNSIDRFRSLIHRMVYQNVHNTNTHITHITTNTSASTSSLHRVKKYNSTEMLLPQGLYALRATYQKPSFWDALTFRNNSKQGVVSELDQIIESTILQLETFDKIHHLCNSHPSHFIIEQLLATNQSKQLQ